MHLLIDNYDSFTYNIVQALGGQGAKVDVRRNDEVTVDEALALAPESLVISPGPGTPDDAGVSVAVIRALRGKVPILGVCLGHQCLGEAFGGTVAGAGEIVHGKMSVIHHDGRGVLAGVANPFEGIRYHSLAVQREGLPDCLEVTAWTDRDVIMGLRHKELAVEGVQFHPESIMTAVGKDVLRNFLEMK